MWNLGTYFGISAGIFVAIIGAAIAYWKPKFLKNMLKSEKNVTIVGVLIVLAGLFAFGGATWIADTIQTQSVGGIDFGANDEQIVTEFPNCPTDGDSSLKINFYNDYNKTGNENFDVTNVIESEDGSVFTLTDTTAPTATTIDCGHIYTGKAVSASGAAGDISTINSVINGPATILPDGNWRFTADKSNINIDLGAPQNGVMEFRARDILNDGLAWDATNTTQGKWKIDGSAVFYSSTNATVTAVGTGGEVHFKLFGRVANQSDQVWGDRGIYVMIDAATNKWNEPTVYVNGKLMSDVKDTLNSDEAKAYGSTYEYIYRVDDFWITNTKNLEVDFDINALAGVNPTSTDSLHVDIAAIGQYSSTNHPNTVKTGAVKDDSSQTQVYTLQDNDFIIG